MDQDSFRNLLKSSAATSDVSAQVSAVTPKVKKGKAKKAESSQPTFKPRAVKKQADSYRDRAGERRLGIAHDFAEVEALAEDFERRNADQDRAVVEEQRRYLGGDSEHTVLVKGLDFALLEQNKARAAAATEDDDALEQAYAEASLPQKRTREDIVRELKNKRQRSEVVPDSEVTQAAEASLEEAKKAGKFRPIGFKPIGSTEIKKKKKVKGKEDKTGIKKKRGAKLEDGQGTSETKTAPSSKQLQEASTSKLPPPPAPEPELIDEDFDIFEGAGEYSGVDLGDDDDEESEGEINEKPSKLSDEAIAQDEEAPSTGRWFDIGEPELTRQLSAPPPKSKSPSASLHEPAPEDREEGEEEDTPVRLAPLASSAIPSIREFLAMDMENEKQEKRKARKEKKKSAIVKSGNVSD